MEVSCLHVTFRRQTFTESTMQPSILQEVRILSSSNWRPISARLEHSASIREDKRMVIYTETNESGRAHSGNSSCKTRYIVSETPLKISSNKAPAEKPNPRIGVGMPLATSNVCKFRMYLHGDWLNCPYCLL